jgi:23S rRNA pseudouridine1911/1915/1917 synthase
MAKPASTTHIIVIDYALAGQRVDRALALALPALSRTRVQALLERGCVLLQGAQVATASLKVAEGQIFTVIVPPSVEAVPQAEDIPLTIVYEDTDLLVIDKPAGLTVHPAPGNYQHTLVNALLAHCGDSLSGIGGVRRPGIVHRLDKLTSGLMVAAKNDRAHAALSRQLADRSLSRKYLAVVWGRTPDEGRIDKPLGRSPADRKKMAVVANGREAITDFTFLRPVGMHASLIRCKLQTGRTHQIRVHMAAIGHPLVGDPVYGGRAQRNRLAPALAAFPRQALHAAGIGFTHPATGTPMEFTSALPEDIAILLTSV